MRRLDAIQQFFNMPAIRVRLIQVFIQHKECTFKMLTTRSNDKMEGHATFGIVDKNIRRRVVPQDITLANDKPLFCVFQNRVGQTFRGWSM
jgi:hypothetical protein